MQIHEITRGLTEGIMDTVKGLGATALTKAFGTGYKRDPLTGKMVPSAVTQTSLDYQTNRNISKWTNKAIKDFYTYVNQVYKNVEPSPDEFKEILEKWAGSYLPPSNWKWPDSYSQPLQQTISSLLNSVQSQYEQKPDGSKLKQVYNDVARFIAHWLEITREQEKEYAEKRHYQTPGDPYVQFGQKVRSSFDLRRMFRANSNIYTTGNSDIDNFLSGMGFRVDLRDYGSIAPSTPGIFDKINNSSEFQGWASEIKSRLPAVTELKSTGNSVVDDFFRALRIRIV